jgi:hypothetical protein
MAAERKISDDELERLRSLATDGWSHQDLAEAFGITPQHAGRLVRGEQRPVIAAEAGTVSDAVEAFLADADVTGEYRVLAAAARSLASKMDACAGSDSASAAQALPRLNAQLVSVLELLARDAFREHDSIDILRERRRARLMAAGMNGNGA